MTNSLNFLAILVLVVSFISCTSEKTKDAANTKVNSKPTRIITGIVNAIQNGKDGYTATLTTLSQETYFALVSIVNLGGPDNYVRFDLGDEVVLSGDYWNSDEKNHLTVKKIIKHTPLPDEYCWLSDGPVNLYQEPNISSKNYGRFFQGENLVVIENKTTNNNQQWTKVRFLNSVRMGYEDQFADGQPMHEGIESMEGWIGGKTTAVVRCK